MFNGGKYLSAAEKASLKNKETYPRLGGLHTIGVPTHTLMAGTDTKPLSIYFMAPPPDNDASPSVFSSIKDTARD